MGLKYAPFLRTKQMTDKQIASVFETSDYDKFKTIDGNRSVNPKHVAEIVKSIEDNGFLDEEILVNEKFEIINGQHRFNALKELNLPIQYRIKNGIGIKEVKALNRNTSNWKLVDYVSTTARNNASYKKLIDFLDKEKKPVSHTALLFSEFHTHNRGGYGINDFVKDEKFKMLFTEERIKKVFELDYALSHSYACHEWYAGRISSYKLLALRFFVHIDYFNSIFDMDRFLKVLAKKSKDLKQFFCLRSAIKNFGDLYNENVAASKKLDFSQLYEEFKKLVPTGKFLENID